MRLCWLLFVFLQQNLFYITKEEPEAYNTVVVPKGQRVSLLLSDGTTVWLNAESRFSYPAKFSENIERSHWKERAILRWHIIQMSVYGEIADVEYQGVGYKI